MISIHRAQQLMKKINSFCIPETGRTKGIEAYLNEWLDYIREHDKLTTPIPDDTKLEMLRMITKNPQDIITHLEKHHSFTLKGTGPIAFHLGCDCTRRPDGVLCFAPEKYIQKMIKTYVDLFGQQPKQCTSPLEKGDHPKLDNTEGLDLKHIKICQLMIGALQWAIQLGRFDIMTAVMTLSSFRANPRQGHLDRAKCIYGYSPKMHHTSIRIRTAVPDLSALPTVDYSWERTAYVGAMELTPEDIPKPLGKPVRMVSYVDSDLHHSMLDGKAVTAILHFLNQTPFDWCPKKQATVETATCGAEYSAARTLKSL